MAKERLDAAILRLREENWLPKIARKLDLTRQATSKWRRVPAERVRKVAKITRIPLHFLRPDLYEDPAIAAQKEAAKRERARARASARRNHRAAAHA